MKQVILTAVVAMSFIGFSNKAIAQNKIGYISTEELIAAMPEAEKASAELQDYQTSLQQQGEEYVKELNEKDSIFVRDSSKLSPAAKDLRRNDLIQLYQKVQGWNQNMQQLLQEKQQALLGPIKSKALETIKAVAKESGYAYVLDAATIIVSPPADDILPLVKKKLGLKDTPAAGAGKPAPKAPGK